MRKILDTKNELLHLFYPHIYFIVSSTCVLLPRFLHLIRDIFSKPELHVLRLLTYGIRARCALSVRSVEFADKSLRSFFMCNSHRTYSTADLRLEKDARRSCVCRTIFSKNHSDNLRFNCNQCSEDSLVIKNSKMFLRGTHDLLKKCT